MLNTLSRIDWPIGVFAVDEADEDDVVVVVRLLLVVVDDVICSLDRDGDLLLAALIFFYDFFISFINLIRLLIL
jgi:hypothetical protein